MSTTIAQILDDARAERLSDDDLRAIDTSRLTISAWDLLVGETAEAHHWAASERAWAYLQAGAMTIPLPPWPPSRPDVLPGEAHGGGDCDGMPRIRKW